MCQTRSTEPSPGDSWVKLMAKSESFRFAIADNKVRSECWSVFANKSDVYLTASAYKRTLKVSLHGSGVCQIALLEDSTQTT